jgi:hypothetical protein
MTIDPFHLTIGDKWNECEICNKKLLDIKCFRANACYDCCQHFCIECLKEVIKLIEST